jgi:hypothetical protein
MNNLLQPTAADVLAGNLLEDSLGHNAKKNIPLLRINFMSGTVASYSRVLNNSEALKHIEDANMLSACISTISESRELAKDAAKEKKSQEAKSKQEKKANDQAEFEKKKGELHEELVRDLLVFVAAGGTIPKTLTKDKLLNLLKFYFKDKTAGLSSMKWDAIIDLVKRNSKEITSVGRALDFDVDIGDALVDALAEEAFTEAAEGTASMDAIGNGEPV